MRNKTQSILSDLLHRLRRDCIDYDPEVTLCRRDFQSLYEDFSRAHRDNPALLRAVDGLLDARAGWDETAGERQFLLGLQMGLELGGMDMLADFS